MTDGTRAVSKVSAEDRRSYSFSATAKRLAWLNRGRGERGLLGRGVSVSAYAHTLSCSATAYCLLPTACAVLLSAMYVYVCVCVESIHVVKQFYLGPRCVCVCGPTMHGEATELPFVVACVVAARYCCYCCCALLLLLSPK